MSLRLLYIFKMVVECGNVSEAAKVLYMSQPAVSHALKELEEKLQVILFERIARRLYLSENGRQLYQKACSVLTVYEEFQSDAKQLHQAPMLRIGSSITNANLLLPKLLADFQKDYIGEVQVQVHNAQTIQERLMNNEVDLAFLEGPLFSEDMVEIELPPYPIAVFCANACDLSIDEPVSIRALAEKTWLLREQGSAIRGVLDSAMRLVDEVVHPAWESANSQVLIEAVKQDLGISILPMLLLTQEQKKQTIRIIPLKETLLCHNHIVYHKEKHIHKGMRQFLSFCQNRACAVLKYYEMHDDVGKGGHHNH